MHLAFDNHWINYVADIINCDEALDFCGACFRIHFYDGNISSEWISEVGGIIEAVELNPWLQPFWEIVRYIRSQGNLTEAD